MKLCYLRLICTAIILLGMTGLRQANAQSPFNIRVTNGLADQVLRGEYNPSEFVATSVEDDLDRVVCNLEERVSTDTLRSLIQTMQNFETRNTYADTASSVRGIGAARRWVYRWFETVSAQNENRLLVSYMEFEMPDAAACGAGVFRNIFAVLPGRDTSDQTIMVVEGHLDSRCEVLCDTACFAPGAEDNGSGSALVLELARVMSPFTYDHTIVFLLTVGEEQGLFGAEAFADYCLANGIGVKAVQNNDVTGGVVCGPSSSPPSCSGDGDIDSVSVRLFSSGVINSIHKDYARFMKTVYREKVSGVTDVPMAVRLMSQEDRTGRGGDHIPFRENGFRAIRVCASNEHGDANTASAAYTGRQHSVRDIIGVDTDGDLEPDSFFVDFRYLKRNTVFNGASLAVAASGPDAPDFTISDDGLKVRVEVIDPAGWNRYRIGLRRFGNDFEALYEISGTTTFDMPGIEPSLTYRICVAAVNDRGVQSLFSVEQSFFSIANTLSMTADTASLSPLDCLALGIDDTWEVPQTQTDAAWQGVKLLPARPNPFQNKSYFTVRSESLQVFEQASLQLFNEKGREVWRYPMVIRHGEQTVLLEGTLPNGTYTLSLSIDGQRIDTQRVVCAGGS